MLPSHQLITQHQQREYLRQQGFTPEQISLLILDRAFYLTGKYQYEPGEYRRLHFARWLYQHGKIEH
jgi:hypothetical protein